MKDDTTLKPREKEPLDQLMPTANTDESHTKYHVQPSKNKPKFIRNTTLATICIMLVGFCLGFFWFIETTKINLEQPLEQAEGIVVLTGGKERISRSLELLANNKADRLLISGVNPHTTIQQIIKNTPQYEGLFKCCIDIDRKALNTIGNAKETATWVKQKHISNLIVVTSAYHMPRAIFELHKQMPSVELIPAPVFHSELNLQQWYKSYSTTRLLFREYVKYILVRIRVEVGRIYKPYHTT
ncbi:YdcF family protein [Flexibacterium corallicola]|uniref:YdcF family protein n=1 Tax=Flexibacterium corallicola TaxID=3037259 RepID=UPI00286F43CA|nr:YdcF family protein [Pseudovibrio sp. M1P-2-3]